MTWSSWPLERVLFAMAGTVTIASVVLAILVSPWFLLLTAFVGVSQWLYVTVGVVPRLARRRTRLPREAGVPPMTAVGPMGRLGAWTADHFRAVLVAWLVLAVGLGVFAPRVEHALSGAGWEASGSQSVQARELIDQNFGGQSSAALMVVVHSPSATVGDPAFTATVDRAAVILREDSRVASVALPLRGILDLAGRSHRDRQRRREGHDDRDGRGRRRAEGEAARTPERRTCR